MLPREGKPPGRTHKKMVTVTTFREKKWKFRNRDWMETYFSSNACSFKILITKNLLPQKLINKGIFSRNLKINTSVISILDSKKQLHSENLGKLFLYIIV